MKRWIHMMCGKASVFPAAVDPNAINAPCQSCKVALGGWVPA